MISCVIYAIIVEGVSSVFIFYCFDKRFRVLGWEGKDTLKEVYNVFEENIGREEW
jgi:hypothetical protein